VLHDAADGLDPETREDVKVRERIDPEYVALCAVQAAAPTDYLDVVGHHTLAGGGAGDWRPSGAGFNRRASDVTCEAVAARKKERRTMLLTWCAAWQRMRRPDARAPSHLISRLS
jgi:hypothetical protein